MHASLITIDDFPTSCNSMNCECQILIENPKKKFNYMGHLLLINSSIFRHITNKVFDGGKKMLNIIGNIGIYHKLQSLKGRELIELTSGLFT